ncbi:MAG: GNAT family N-acetyltransferase [Propionibacteriaceae bacterium]|nr:GNAT family N-acetyltransferase [Propionibacteriaceae bacterium]
MLINLTQGDAPRLKALFDAAPLETIFLSSRIERFGLNAARLGCPVLGVMRGGQLVAAVHYGANLMAVGDPDAVDEVIERLGPRSRTQSILGPAVMVDRLYRGLVQRWGTSWAAVRDMRAHQPLMLWRRGDPLHVVPDQRVRAMDGADLDPYFQAAVRMYTEEVGVSPLDATNSYRSYVHFLVTNRRAFGAIDNGHVWFKTDVGATYANVCQIQGVWLDPTLRGRGLAEPLMAAAVWLLDPAWSQVSLYVNDYNVRARRMYDRLGFQQVGELATVLY